MSHAYVRPPQGAEGDACGYCYFPKDHECHGEPSMHLPEGKTCGDCVRFNFCKGFFGCKPTSVECDWDPSRFIERAQGPTPTEGK